MNVALLVVASGLAGIAASTAVAVRAARPLVDSERLDEMVDGGASGAASARRLLAEPDRTPGLVHLLVPTAATMSGWTVVGVTRVLLGGGASSGSKLAVALVLGAAAAALVILLVESLPTAAALAAPERVVASFAAPARGLSLLLAPLVAALDGVAAALLLPVGMWLDGGRGRAPNTDELAALVAIDLDGPPVQDVRSDATSGAGDLGAAEGSEGAARRLLAGALDFLDVRVSDVMAHRDQLVTVRNTSTVPRAEQLVHRSGHSRVLVVGSTGEVTGFLHAKDLIGLPQDKRRGLLPAGLVRVALRVAPEDRLRDVLPRMRRARRHVAVVESEGAVQGLVTLEDVLEAIVGDIRDESDIEGESEIEGNEP